MRFEKLEGGKKPMEWARFRISGISVPFANAIRRTIMSGIDVLAIEDVTFIENSSGLYDEILALRLGLVPLTTPEGMVRRDKCECGGTGCQRCTVKLTIEREEPGMVYSGEIKTDHPEAKPVFDKIPLTLLAEGQKLIVECDAILGKGSEHAKFQPALCTYDIEEFDEKRDHYKFYVESFGAMSVQKLVEKAGEILEAKAKKFAEKL